MLQPVSSSEKSSGLISSAEQRAKLRRYRNLKNDLTQYGITTAGLAVVASLGLIFLYLFSEVIPLLRGASIEVASSYELPADAQKSATEYVNIENYEEIGLSFSKFGQAQFFGLDKGVVLATATMPKADGAEFTAVGESQPVHGLVAYGDSQGNVIVAKAHYELSYPDDKRKITPSLEFPLGETPIELDANKSSLNLITIQQANVGTLIAGGTADRRLLLAVVASKTNEITEETEVTKTVFNLPSLPDSEVATHLQLDETGHYLIVASNKSKLYLYNITKPNAAERYDYVSVDAGNITAMQFLVATGSLVVGTDKGHIEQWLLVRDKKNRFSLAHVRDFKPLKGTITKVVPEYSRRGFWAADDKGNVGIYFGTSGRTLLTQSLGDTPIKQIGLSPVNNRVVVVDANEKVTTLNVWNKHPEVSFSVLWEKVWYEGRDAPDYIWQASSGSDTNEAKYSFIPLSLGTLKAALFAILFAVPIGVMGAIYSAYFMTAKLRGFVKPTIEIMAALPSVILGFLAGLWLAPFLENNLPAIFSILFITPIVMLVTGFAWSQLPASIRLKVPEGWEAVILIVPVVAMIWLSVALSPHIEVWWFHGSMRQWISDSGIKFEQRNAMIVGLVMGFAVIPSIFSVAEDAVFSVPRHLTQGSLALGATRWQTMVGVVLPTASPGIFSAVMMGFGRAVGETMIVLMATGNSPVVNFNIFEGMRTLSANIAVEMPETAVGSTHFRVLFLAALLLLALTFIVNTLAEVVRQRLRKRYSNL